MNKYHWSSILLDVGVAFAMCGAAAMLFNDWEASALLWMLCSQANLAAACLRGREEEKSEKEKPQVSPVQSHDNGKPVDYWE